MSHNGGAAQCLLGSRELLEFGQEGPDESQANRLSDRLFLSCFVHLGQLRTQSSTGPADRRLTDGLSKSSAACRALCHTSITQCMWIDRQNWEPRRHSARFDRGSPLERLAGNRTVATCCVERFGMRRQCQTSRQSSQSSRIAARRTKLETQLHVADVVLASCILRRETSTCRDESPPCHSKFVCPDSHLARVGPACVFVTVPGSEQFAQCSHRRRQALHCKCRCHPKRSTSLSVPPVRPL